MSHAVLVLGAGGFIGRQLSEAIARSGRPVIACTRQPVAATQPGITNVVSGFSRSEDFLPLLDQADAVVHAASISTPGSSVAQPQLDGNLRTTLALVEALQAHPQRRLLYLSSGGTVYGDAGHPLDESAPLHPRSYHAAGKIAAEYFIHAWTAQYEGTAVVLRPSNVYGPGQLPRDGFGIIPTAFQRVLQRQPLEILGDGSSVRDYLYIDDLVALCTGALERPLEPGVHTFNAAAGNALALDALLDAIDRTTGHPLQRVYRPRRSVDIRRIALDGGRARRAFDWQPRLTLAQGLERTWHWFSTPR